MGIFVVERADLVEHHARIKELADARGWSFREGGKHATVIPAKAGSRTCLVASVVASRRRPPRPQG